MIRASRKRKIVWIFISVIILIIIWLLWILYKNNSSLQEAVNTKYDAFNTTFPLGFQIHGIDVSSYQKAIAWDKVKAMEIEEVSMGFAFIKATEGLNDHDRNFAQNFKHAKAAGIICGAYHFFLATKSGEKQAANFIQNVTLNSGDLPPVVDIEQRYGVPTKLMKQRLKEYLIAIEKHYGVKPIIYSYASFYDTYLGAEFNEYPLWVAHYFESEKPRVQRDWLFWQHSEKGTVDGITTPVDCNVFYGDSLAFKQILIP
ncbi:MAG: glycoside hydrolase family 25 protein [Chitinophagaceae bacterium]